MPGFKPTTSGLIVESVTLRPLRPSLVSITYDKIQTKDKNLQLDYCFIFVYRLNWRITQNTYCRYIVAFPASFVSHACLAYWFRRDIAL